MSSIRIYKEDPYQTANSTQITAIGEKDGMACIACEASVFFPEGGGQPSDIGTVSCGNNIFNITEAYDEDLESDVWHRTDAPAGVFEVGDQVELSIDWDTRFKNMQRHCGEHMLSGAFHALFGGVNRGFHMGEDYITIDIDMDGQMLTDEEIDLAERTVNDAIWADLPVTVTYFENYEASLVMPVRKQVPHDGEVSVVSVGELPDPFDCIACCGTHPSTSGQVGLVAIYKHEPNKGMNRLYFDCGIMAKEKLSADFRLLTEVANRNSCSPQDLLHKLDVDNRSIADMKAQIAAMTAYIKEKERTAILAGINSTDSVDAGGSGPVENSYDGSAATDNVQKVFVYSLDLISVDDLLKLGFSVISETEGKLLVLLHPGSCTALLFSSGDFKCGALIKEKAPAFNGRGGGRDDNARAVFSNQKDMRAFAASL